MHKNVLMCCYLFPIWFTVSPLIFVYLSILVFRIFVQVGDNFCWSQKCPRIARRWSFKCLDASMFVHRPLCSPLYMFANVGGGGRGGMQVFFIPPFSFSAFALPAIFVLFSKLKPCLVGSLSGGSRKVIKLSLICQSLCVAHPPIQQIPSLFHSFATVRGK